MKNQALFSLKDKSKKLTCCLQQFLFGTLRVNVKNKVSGYIFMPLYNFSFLPPFPLEINY